MDGQKSMKSFQQFITEKYNINTVNIKCMPGFFDFMLNFSKKNKYAKMIIDDSIHSQRFNPNEYYDLCEDLLNTSNYNTKLGNNNEAREYYKEYQSCREVLDCIDDLVMYEQKFKNLIHFEDKILKKDYTFKCGNNIKSPESYSAINVIHPDAGWVKGFLNYHKNNEVIKQIVKQKNSLYSVNQIKYYLDCYGALCRDYGVEKYCSSQIKKEIEKSFINYNELVEVLKKSEL